MLLGENGCHIYVRVYRVMCDLSPKKSTLIPASPNISSELTTTTTMVKPSNNAVTTVSHIKKRIHSPRPPTFFSKNSAFILCSSTGCSSQFRRLPAPCCFHHVTRHAQILCQRYLKLTPTSSTTGSASSIGSSG